MSKTTSAVQEKQDNPLVSIRYDPEKALTILGQNTLAMIGKLQGFKVIASVNELKNSSAALEEAEGTLEEMTAFRDTLAMRVRDAYVPLTKIPGFQGSSINITLTIPAKQQLETGIRTVKNMRGNYLAAEQEKQRREQLAKQAEQDRINREAADKAAKEAKKQGADKQTVADIRENVLATPAPIVTSKAAETAKEVGASVRYGYSAEITDVKKFLELCLSNEVFLNAFKAAIPDVEKAFRTMAAAQKEAFDYPGIRYKRNVIDVERRA